MYCKKCGNALPDYAEVCNKCGTKTGVSSSVKPKRRKMIFIPIGIGAVAMIVLVAVLAFWVRSKDDIVQPSGSSEQTTSIIDNAPVTLPESTPSNNIIDNAPATSPVIETSNSAIGTDSQPIENNEIIADTLSFSVNGVDIPVCEAGYAGNVVNDDIQNTVVLWGENSKYIVMAMVNVPEDLIGLNVTYSGLAGTDEEPLAAALFLYDIESARNISGMTGKGITDQVIKIGSYKFSESMNLLVSGDLHDEDNKTTLSFSFSGKFDYFVFFDMLNTLSAHYYEALNDAVNIDDPTESTVDEVVIAGESYSLDTDYINLVGKGVTNADIENLKYLTNLTNIQLQNNSGVTDLSTLSGLTKLESLWLDDTGISDLSPIAGCKNLKELGIKNTKVKDISVLSNFTKLKKFVAVNCNINDISSVANCPEMHEIWLSFNPITDFSPLVGLNNLATVGLDNCCNMTWDILKTLYGLNFALELKLNGNGITDEMAEVLSYNLYSPDGNGLWWY